MAKQDTINPQDLADFTAAFQEEAGSGQPDDANDGFGLMPGEEPPQASAPEVVAPSGTEVVIAVIEPSDETVEGQRAADAQASAEAQAVTEQNNAQACDSGTPPTSGEQEAAAQSGVDKTPPVNPDDDSDVPEADQQAFKSWRGRLKAEEQRLAQLRAELESKAAKPPVDEPQGEKPSAASEALEQGAQQAGAQGDQKLANAMQDAAEQVESGEITADEAMQQLRDDFGEAFIGLIEKVASAAASKTAKPGAAPDEVAALREQVDALRSDAERRHFETIHAVHPDFMDVHKSPEFQEYLKANPGAAKVADTGSALEINKMLADYKQSRKPAPSASVAATPPAPPVSKVDAVDPAAADAAGAVPSRGVRLPERPQRAGSEDYAKAWEEF